MSLHDNIREYIARNTSDQQGKWLHKGDIEKVTFFHKDGRTPYLTETVNRTLRTLESEKLIAQRSDKNNKSIEYKFLPEQLKDKYITYSERTDKSKIFHEEKQN